MSDNGRAEAFLLDQKAELCRWLGERPSAHLNLSLERLGLLSPRGLGGSQCWARNQNETCRCESCLYTDPPRPSAQKPLLQVTLLMGSALPWTVPCWLLSSRGSWELVQRPRSCLGVRVLHCLEGLRRGHRWDITGGARDAGPIPTQILQAVLSSVLRVPSLSVGGEPEVAVTDNCNVGQWPLCQLIHNCCHHVLSAECQLGFNICCTCQKPAHAASEPSRGPSLMSCVPLGRCTARLWDNYPRAATSLILKQDLWATPGRDGE